ncbi:MAG TPA: SDR family NAD(P)-dependent oxidoreductase [Vicinamibacterales bacterium]|jgi:acyl transferase domain-containing protein/NAD(P)H-dependent flavin oxidoreductase YrpB (nitropropane dioxygenase family)/NAD(P)-dependent dehydrogenase (short-subunit alcohol dehydrogenase family)/acyl carrier protein
MSSSIADLSFVWPASRLGGVAGLAAASGCGTILDCRTDDLHALAPALRGAGISDVLLDLRQWTASAAASTLHDAGVRNAWVDCGPLTSADDRSRVAAQFTDSGSDVAVVPVVCDLALLDCLFAERAWPVLALKGNEASGFVSGEAAHVLLAIAGRARRINQRDTRLVIWGGLATPDATAAFLSTGAQGVVFESVHWLTDAMELEPRLQHSLRSLRADSTRVVGANVGLHCRLFDKGNSRAVRALVQSIEGGADAAPNDARTALIQRITSASISPLVSTLGADELVPLGPEAAFAGAFVERFGSAAGDALTRFRDQVMALCSTASGRIIALSDGPVTREWGTTYPIVQGAMSWITDQPDFARQLADAGALPTIALGMRSRSDLERDFAQLAATLGDRPYAVNLIVLPENPVRDEQFAWIEATRPPFVVIAAGDPSFARRLGEKGLKVLYVASDEGLLRVALEAGVRYVILEGNEAGGHVGPQSLTTVAQTMHELKRRQPALFDGARLVMAGGIFDGPSAHRAILLGADALQLGTAYLATEEIVATGALSYLYQQQVCEARPGDTMVLGEPLGLRIRSLRSPKTERLAHLERHMGESAADERELRRGVEAEATGTLLIAARGVRSPGGQKLDEQVCRDEGQFMSGAAAGCIDEVRSLAALHRDIMAAPPENRQALAAPPVAHVGRDRSVATAPRRGERIAITAMAMANSLGNSLDDIWAGVVEGRSGVSSIPTCKWDHGSIYDPRPGTPGKTYSNVAAFLDLNIDRKDIGIPPQDFRTMAKSTRLTLWLARQVVTRAALLESGIPPERIGVMIAQNSGEAASTLADLTITMSAPLLARTVAETLGLTAEQTAEVERRLCADRLSVDDTTLLGRLNCTAGGFVCNQYGFMGPSYAVTAACSTSLVALYNAVHLIRAGAIDAALVGGGEEWLLPAHFIEFAAVGALAGISGRERPISKASRPFDLERDGMVLGEGGVMIVVERESVARRRGARIHAFVTGVGASNNNHGMVESSAATQQIAIRNAYADAAYAPDTVDLVECHATSTAQGDVEEVRALKSFFPSGRRTALASFKSQIGHTLGASGLTSLVRGVLAMERRTLPPSLNYETPDPAIDLEGWGFDVSGEARAWPESTDRPRRFEVNAFGFGGSNYVTLLEESAEDRGVVFVSGHDDEGQALLPADVSRHDLCGVLLVNAESPDITLRAAIADPDPAAREQALSRLRRPVEPAPPERLFVIARQGLYAADAAAAHAPLAFIYPGQGCQYVGMGRELASTFPVVREALERMAAVADFDLLDLLYNAGDEMLRNTRWQQPALFALQFALTEFFRSCGVEPAAVAGHSLGETTALAMGGAISWEDGFRLVNKRGECMERLSNSGIDGGSMIATDVPLAKLQEKLAARRSVVVSNDNSPRQIVLGGDTDEIADLQQELEREGSWVRRLRVSMAFHTPRSRVLVDEIEPFLNTLEIRPPRLPVLVNSTNGVYPDDPAQIRAIISAHLVSGVRWRENVERLGSEFGIRVFLELGPKDVLSNLVGDTLPHALTIPTALPNAEVATCRSALARVAALGHVRSAVTPLRLVVRHDAAPAAGTAGDGERERGGGDGRGRSGGDGKGRGGGDGRGQSGGDGRGQSGAGVPPAVSARTGGSHAAEDRPIVPPESPFVEDVIGLIMEATGYERHEISPDMDIRQDLSIRSSRLPVIMDAAERRFGIRIRLEELIEVRTVGDLAASLQKMVDRGGEPGAAPSEPLVIDPLRGKQGRPTDEDAAFPPRLPLRRYVWADTPLTLATPSPVTLAKGARVVILSWNAPSALAPQIGAWFSKRYRAQTDEVVLASGSLLSLSPEDVEAEVARRIPALGSAAGLVVLLDGLATLAADGSDVAPVLTATFAALKALLRSADREFCIVIDGGQLGAGAAASEGTLGVLLSAAHEYSSAVFRHATVEPTADIPAVLERCLDTSLPLVQLRFRRDEVLTQEARPEPLHAGSAERFPIRRGDVVLVTGGARGITGHLAAALAPFGPRLVLLGRTPLDPSVDHRTLLGGGGAPEEVARRHVDRIRPDAAEEQRARAAAQLVTEFDIVRTLDTLANAGLVAEYWSCDVSRPADVEAVVGRAVQRFGRIDGIVHGAGVLRDALLDYMTVADFAAVVAVKVGGLARLFQAAQPHGLRFVVGLSSLAAVTGNAGQANYAAASRAMAGLIRAWSGDGSHLRGQTLWLPPIKGLGMASGREIRELLERRGLGDAYAGVDEVGTAFAHELVLAQGAHSDAILVRMHPPVRTVRFQADAPAADSAATAPAPVEFDSGEFPLLDRVEVLDRTHGLLVARRTFTAERDVWLQDHRPFKELEQPIVSAIMLVEAALEAARLLYPHLDVLDASDVDFLEMLACRPGVPLAADLVCRSSRGDQGSVVCDVALTAVDDPTQPPRADHAFRSFGCRVRLGAGTWRARAEAPWLAPGTCDTEAKDRRALLGKYETKTGLTGRYRVLHGFDGTAPGLTAGHTLYAEEADFAGRRDNRYQYSPYLLEAMLQAAHFYPHMRDESDERKALPMRIGRLRIGRRAVAGENIRVEGRCTADTEAGMLWDLRAVDRSGEVVLEVSEFLARWYTS